MIPNIIHYCWFGNNPLPESAQKCIASWKKYFPDYEIKEWSELNYDVHKISYISEAYDAKKYAFVSDYARFDILYQYGGIYFDTDVEVIKSFDSILQNGGFMGFEGEGKVNSGLGMGCNVGLDIISQILRYYTTLSFINADGSYNLQTVVEYVTKILHRNGLNPKNEIQVLNGLTIYPTEYFAPKSILTEELTITNNAYSIHHYDASWVSENEKSYYKFKRTISRLFGRNIGKIISTPYFLLLNIKNYGFRIGVKKILDKMKNEK
jgi:mannosyltransferase OCH1-like enzyme